MTTLRIDKVTDGRRAEVEYTKDWKLDANRSDSDQITLTIYVDVNNKKVLIPRCAHLIYESCFPLILIYLLDALKKIPAIQVYFSHTGGI